MPNYVYNTVTFAHEDVEKVKKLVVTADRAFDFDRIIPMPESLKIVSGSSTFDADRLLKGEAVSAECYPDEGEEPDPSVFYNPPCEKYPKTLPELRVFARLIKSNQDQYGHGDWYDWACANWGTKWNACEPYWSDNVVHFDTAWSDPKPIFIQLSKLLGITFTVACEEEGLAFCSVTTYSPDGYDRESEEGIKGLVLLGQSRDDIIARYEDWYDEEEMEKLNEELDSLGL